MSRPGETSGFSATLRLMCPGDSHQDRATDDHAERGRYGAVAAAERGRHVLQRAYLPLDDPLPARYGRSPLDTPQLRHADWGVVLLIENVRDH